MPPLKEFHLGQPYARVLIPDPSGGYSAEVLEFPGCFAEGETAEEALHALDRAAGAWVLLAMAQGQDIPEPISQQPYQGKILLRLPKSLHRKAVMVATRDGVSLNQWLLAVIGHALGEAKTSLKDQKKR